MLFLKLNSIMNILIVYLTIAYTCNGKNLQDIELLKAKKGYWDFQKCCKF